MRTMIQLLAAALLLAALWAVLRFALGLRWAKVARQEARRSEESQGRRVVAEIPLADGLLFFLEDDSGFYWGRREARKPEIVGARLILNGGVIGAFSQDGATLPEPPAAEDYEGRERWDVLVYLRDGRTESVPCGSLREGVSREIASRVFAAVRQSCGFSPS
jgi:hypothetical protein